MWGGVVWFLLLTVASCQEGAVPNSRQVERIGQQPPPTLQHDRADFNMREASYPEMEAVSSGLDARTKALTETTHHADNSNAPSSIFEILANLLPMFSDFYYREEKIQKNTPAGETDYDDMPQGDEPLSDEESPGVSLVFVFDSTGSMEGELKQVKVGARKIQEALLAKTEIVIHNFILVPFKDENGPVTVTTDPKLFQRKIDNISVYGGQDCPEHSLTALLEALKLARPFSYFYVFTDARPDDTDLLSNVTSLIQSKQAKVVFILTGYCELNDDGIYTDIAAASSGDVYRLSKSQVEQVLDYVKITLNTNQVNLLSLNRPAPDKEAMDNHTVVVDETLRELTVSLSGQNAGLSVTDPRGVSKTNSTNVEPLLTLENVKIISVHEPDPGRWQLSVASDSDYSLRATGRSAVSFRHGFSSQPTGNMAETNLRPLKGASCYLIVQASDSAVIHNLTTVKINGLNGTLLKQLPLIPHPSVPGTFYVANFTPPAEFFHLEMTGFGKNGFPIKRVTTTAISSSLPEAPLITMKNKTVGHVHEDLNVSCHVMSLVPFSVVWLKNGIPVSSALQYSQTHSVDLLLSNVDEDLEGDYTCKAENIAGTRSATSKVTIIGSPPVAHVLPRIVAVVGDVIEIPCHVKSDFTPTVGWMQLSTKNNYSGILHPVLNGNVYKNNSLIITNVTEADEGWFVCSAGSKAGATQVRTFLEVRDPLRVSVPESYVTFTKGESKKLECFAGGRPAPKLHWRHDSLPITEKYPHIYLEELNGQLNLIMDFLNQQHAGVYSCVATNSDDSVSAQVEMVYTEKPKVKAIANNVMVRLHSEAVLGCIADGIPVPHISWKRGDQLIESDNHFVASNGSLRIPVVSVSDAGEFTCVARNALGEAMDHIGLFVGHPPTFIQKPRDKKIQFGHNGTVFCIVMGSPPPDVHWSRLDGEFDRKRMLTLVNGALRIINARVEDAGRYICNAENHFGNISAEVVVKVTGTEKPKIDKSVTLSVISVVPGGGVGIPCGVALGNPPGKVTWLKNGEPVLKNQSSIGGNGILELNESAALSGGNYTCFVENPLGNATRTFQLDVMEEPFVQGNSTELKNDLAVILGKKIILPCPVTGNPRPKITWSKQGIPVKLSSSVYQDVNGSLILDNVGESFGGSYTCTGINELGSTSATVNLQVYVPPKPLNGVVDVEAPKEVVEGYVVVFDCQMYAVPAPNVSWFKDSKPLMPDDLDFTSQILRFVATVDDGGIYKCIVSNAAGFITKEFKLNILVPPRIIDPGDEPQVAKAGSSVTLRCGVTGTPTPEVLWRRHGTYLNLNTSDMMITGVSLVLTNVSEDAGGAYICEAENTAGIAQQTFYLHVTFPPRITEEGNETSVMIVREGDEFSIPCAAEGSPRPDVGWFKDGVAVHPYAAGIVIHPDNALVFLQVREEHAGVYQCYANNSEGFAEREYRLEVLVPPSMLTDIPNRIEVNEGEMLSLVCPASASPPPIIQWKKDGQSIGTLNKERGDEPPLRFSVDRRQLLLAEAHPTDSGNYSCSAVNSAGRTDATFSVAVLMIPHFEEFNHIARRTTLVGGYVSLNCSVSGNPLPQVTWRKDMTPVLPGRPPGVLVSRDQYHLIIPSARLLHTGTYTCIATNKIASKEREFYVTVYEPPKIPGEGLENFELMLKDKLILECPADGEPKPQISWYVEYCDGSKQALNVTDARLVIDQVDADNSAIYSCDAVSTAGTASKHFNVTILVPPEIEGNEMTENVIAAEGDDISLKCMIRGQPRPKVTWLHNGIEVDKPHKRRKRDVVSLSEDNSSEMVATLKLSDVDVDTQGLYTAVASNRAGFSNKNFRVVVAETPKIPEGRNSTKVVALTGSDAVLTCPIEASPAPKIDWIISLDERFVLRDGGRELVILNSTVNDTGNWFCTGINAAGNTTTGVSLQILEAPWFPEGSKDTIETLIHEDVILTCKPNGSPPPLVSWMKDGEVISNDNSTVLSINRLEIADSGTYTCVAKNAAGAAEKSITLRVFQPPTLRNLLYAKEQFLNISLHSRLELDCPFDGHPPPYVTWYNDDEEIHDNPGNGINLAGNKLLILSAKPEMTGTYFCFAENLAGNDIITFHIAVYVLASWSAWSNWTDCTATCGSGLQTRERFCNVTDVAEDYAFVNKTNCVGKDRESRTCGVRNCPVNGGWGAWSEWGECSATCGTGTRRRHRQCSNPVPSFGGQPCIGLEIETEDCNLSPCGSKWFPWASWSPCSATCGKGVRRRTRFCKPSHSRQKPCKDKVQMEICHAQPCSASLQIKGTLNGQPIDANIQANLTGNGMEAKLALDNEAAWFPYAPLLLAPVAWNSANEEGSAANGFSLTRGRFLSQSQVSFDSGEGLAVRTEGRGVNPEGQMTVQIEVAGEAPIFEPAASVHIKSMEQDFIQVGDSTLMGLSTDTLISDNQKVPFRVNSSVSYDSALGKMPYLAEKFKINDIQNDDSGLGFTANTSISPIAQAVCPPGFRHDEQHMLCSDVDECLSNPCPAGQACINSWGAYSCSCMHGYVSDEHDICVDRNECEDLEPRCSHSCTNTDGSFYCFCSMGYTLAPDGTSCLGEEADDDYLVKTKNDSLQLAVGTGLEMSCPTGFLKDFSSPLIPSCNDVDECEMNPNICGEDGLCLNTQGSFQCLDITCPTGFIRESPSTSCYAECDVAFCIHGSKIAETIIFHLLKLSSENFRPYEDLVHLAVEESSTVSRQHSRIIEGNALRLRTADGQSYLYAAFPLKPKTLYRVVAEVKSLGNSDELLYNTKFVVFVTLTD